MRRNMHLRRLTRWNVTGANAGSTIGLTFCQVPINIVW